MKHTFTFQTDAEGITDKREMHIIAENDRVSFKVGTSTTQADFSLKEALFIFETCKRTLGGVQGRY